MLIVIEGARNSGKTTLTGMLKTAIGTTAYPIKFQRTSKPAPPVFMIDFLTRHYLALIDSRSVAILDRFHLTEFVMRSLDGKVDKEVLMTTTHMIDYTLKNMKALTYVLEAEPTARFARLKFRDIDHREPEWPNVKELDGAWAIAKKTFNHSNVKIVKSNTMAEMEAIVADAKRYVSGGKNLEEKIPFLPPIIKMAPKVKELVLS